MRIITGGIAAAFVVASAFGAAASPAVSVSHNVKNGSALEMVRYTHSSMYRSHYHGTRTRSASGARPGMCGTGKYYSKGQCLAAANKKSKIGFPGIVYSNQDMR